MLIRNENRPINGDSATLYQIEERNPLASRGAEEGVEPVTLIVVTRLLHLRKVELEEKASRA